MSERGRGTVKDVKKMKERGRSDDEESPAVQSQ
jgi:hypothetical protein